MNAAQTAAVAVQRPDEAFGIIAAGATMLSWFVVAHLARKAADRGILTPLKLIGAALLLGIGAATFPALLGLAGACGLPLALTAGTTIFALPMLTLLPSLSASLSGDRLAAKRAHWPRRALAAVVVAVRAFAGTVLAGGAVGSYFGRSAYSLCQASR